MGCEGREPSLYQREGGGGKVWGDLEVKVHSVSLGCLSYLEAELGQAACRVFGPRGRSEHGERSGGAEGRGLGQGVWTPTRTV